MQMMCLVHGPRKCFPLRSKVRGFDVLTVLSSVRHVCCEVCEGGIAGGFPASAKNLNTAASGTLDKQMEKPRFGDIQRQ